MTTKSNIDLFLASKKIAVIGVSRKNKFGNNIYKHLKEYRFNVIPVNPNIDFFEGDKCFAKVEEIPDCDAIIISVNKSNTISLVERALSNDIKNIWIQNGSVPENLKEKINFEGINLIVNECVIMFTEPVKGLHSFHRFVNKMLKKYPV